MFSKNRSHLVFGTGDEPPANATVLFDQNIADFIHPEDTVGLAIEGANLLLQAGTAPLLLPWTWLAFPKFNHPAMQKTKAPRKIISQGPWLFLTQKYICFLSNLMVRFISFVIGEKTSVSRFLCEGTIFENKNHRQLICKAYGHRWKIKSSTVRQRCFFVTKSTCFKKLRDIRTWELPRHYRFLP